MTATHVSRIGGRIRGPLTLSSLAGVLAVAVACGGGGGNSGGGSPVAPGGGGGGGGSASATITIGSEVAPRDLRIETGESIRFVNSSSRAHEMKSDPHPTHGSCPPIDRATSLQPGGSVTVGPFTAAGTCYYHDHTDPENGSLRGQIRISVDAPGPGPNYVRP
jgi:plastocyanin